MARLAAIMKEAEKQAFAAQLRTYAVAAVKEAEKEDFAAKEAENLFKEGALDGACTEKEVQQANITHLSRSIRLWIFAKKARELEKKVAQNNTPFLFVRGRTGERLMAFGNMEAEKKAIVVAAKEAFAVTAVKSEVIKKAEKQVAKATKAVIQKRAATAKEVKKAVKQAQLARASKAAVVSRTDCDRAQKK
jgi:hypothetical protein